MTNVTMLDEQAALSVRLAYKALRQALETVTEEGLLEDVCATRAVTLYRIVDEVSASV